MPVVEYINGVKCTYPISREESEKKFATLVKDVLMKYVLEGKISEEEIDSMLEDENKEETNENKQD